MSRLSGFKSLIFRQRRHSEVQIGDEPMHYAALVEVFESEHDFGDVVARPILLEAAERFDEGRAVATIEILHDEVEIIPALKRVEELDNKVRVGCAGHENHSLRFDRRDLILGDHVGLFEDLRTLFRTMSLG